jgi:hypothetical protein
MVCVFVAAVMLFFGRYSDGHVIPVFQENHPGNDREGRKAEYIGEVQISEWWFLEACFRDPKTGLYDSIYQAFTSEKKAREKLEAYHKMSRQMAKMRDNYLSHCHDPGFDETQLMWESSSDRKRLDALKEEYFAIKGERRSIYSSTIEMRKGALYIRSPQLPSKVMPVY